MSDIMVTVPKWFWPEWIAEGDLPGEEWTGRYYDFGFGGRPPRITPGERVYVVAHGRLRGYAPLVELAVSKGLAGIYSYALVRGPGAVAVTIPVRIRGFQGFRYRFWDQSVEIPFHEWRTP